MIPLYRVLRKKYSRAPFDGEGAYRYGGRWSSPGTRVAYASGHQSLALLEYFVHLDKDDPPRDLVLAIAEVPEDITPAKVDVATLPRNWRASPAPSDLARIGDDFIQRTQHCLLVVPSAIVPRENNCLINPQHPDFQRISIQASEPLEYDSRMFRQPAR